LGGSAAYFPPGQERKTPVHRRVKQQKNRRTGVCLGVYAAPAAAATRHSARGAISSTVLPNAGCRRAGCRIDARSVCAGIGCSSSVRMRGRRPKGCQQFKTIRRRSATVATSAAALSAGEPMRSSSFAVSPVAGPSTEGAAAFFDGCRGRAAGFPMRRSIPFGLAGLRFSVSRQPLSSCGYESNAS
jgi:hypothetical protein